MGSDPTSQSGPGSLLLCASLSLREEMQTGEDPREAAEALSRCQAWVERTFARFGVHDLDKSSSEQMARFASPEKAVDCALRIQRIIDQHNASEPGANRIILGLGIHQGPEDDEAWAGTTGALVARALCRLATSSNGIFVSAQVREQIKGKLGLRLMDFRSQPVEGSSEPVHAYQVFPGGSASDLIGTVAGIFSKISARAAPIFIAVLVVGMAALFNQFGFVGSGLDGVWDAPEMESIAVIPFTGQEIQVGGLIYQDQIPAQLIDDLKRYPAIRVLNREESFAQSEEPEDVVELGRRLGVEGVVTGFASTSGDWLLARAAIIRVEDGKQFWSGAYYRRTSEIDGIIEAMVRSMAESLKLAPPPSRQERNTRGFAGLQTLDERAFETLKSELEDALLQMQRLDIDDAQRVTSIHNLATLYYDSGRDAEAIPLYRQVLEAREEALGPDHPEVAVSLNNLASAYTAMADYEKAEPLYRRSLEIRERALGPDHPRTGTALINLASVHHRQGRLEEAEPLYKRALEIREKQLVLEPSSETEILNDKAAVAQLVGQHDEAQRYYRQALDIERGLSGADHPRVATATRNLAVVRGLQGHSEESESLFRRALSIFSVSLGPSHPEVGNTLSDLGELHRRNGRYVEAQKYHEESLESIVRSLGVDHPEVAGALGYLVAIFEVQGRENEAALASSRQNQIRESYLGPVFTYVAARSAGHGVVRDRVRDELSQPQPLHEYLVTVDQGAFVTEKRRLAESLHNLALLYIDLGRYSEAEEQNLRALEIRQALFPRDHPEIAMSMHSLGRIYTLQGRFSDADVRFKEALRIFENTLGARHPHVARCWEGLAGMWRLADRLGEADYADHRARQIRSALGPETTTQ